jgi:hypothetical protein
MASVRAQIMAAVLAKLEQVKDDLAWAMVIRNPREPIGEDQLNALVLMDGGDREPANLTGHVERRTLEFSVGWMAKETAYASADTLLDAALVAISDTLLDPTDIQLGDLAIAIEQMAISEPMIGRGQSGARILCGQSMDFAVEYLAREGDASTPGP